MLSFLLVAVGGCFGAMARFGISNWMKRKIHALFPLATLLVNLMGSLLLGFIIGADWMNSFHLLFGTGFMGAFTTFSTFKLENIQLYAEGERKISFLYLGLTYSFGIFFAYIGLKMGNLLFV